MATFFFNFRQGKLYQVDDLGCEFESVEDAYLGAFSAAQDMWRELLIKRQDPLLCAFDVMDEGGRHLFTLPFVEVLDACRGREDAPRPPVPHPHVLQQTLDHQANAVRVMLGVSSTVADARATLREAWNLLDQVAKLT